MSEKESSLLPAAIVYVQAVDDLMRHLGGMSLNDHVKGVPEKRAMELIAKWNAVNDAKEVIEGYK